jgi:hypothetical protein
MHRHRWRAMSGNGHDLEYLTTGFGKSLRGVERSPYLLRSCCSLDFEFGIT